MAKRGQRPYERRRQARQHKRSERGHQIMHAAGIKPASAYPAVRLGSTDLLVSGRRKRIIELRDRHRAQW